MSSFYFIMWRIGIVRASCVPIDGAITGWRRIVGPLWWRAYAVDAGLAGYCEVCWAPVECHRKLSGALAFYDDDEGDLVPHACTLLLPEGA